MTSESPASRRLATAAVSTTGAWPTSRRFRPAAEAEPNHHHQTLLPQNEATAGEGANNTSAGCGSSSRSEHQVAIAAARGTSRKGCSLCPPPPTSGTVETDESRTSHQQRQPLPRSADCPAKCWTERG